MNPNQVTADYAAFIASKARTIQPAGFECDPSWLPSDMKGFQSEVTLWGLKLGRAAAFLDTGLGKTLVSLGWGSSVVRHTTEPVLYLCPLLVAQQTIREAAKFGIPNVRMASSQADVTSPGIYTTNYQKLHLFDPKAFSGVICGESSILKNFTGATKRALCAAFADTPFRLCETATPAPNDHMELGNHAEFLGVMPANEMLTRWFINDLAHAGEYRLKKHAEADYWKWVASWACCISKPSDLGYSDEGYDLPPLKIIEHIVKGDLTSTDSLVNNAKLNAASLHREMRKTANDRAAMVASLVNAEPDKPWLIWCNTDYEADALNAVLPGAVEVRGSHKDSVKEDRLMGFIEGRYRILITKPSVAGFGMNLQHCCRQAFVGLSYSWEQFYQALRRCWRFGQMQEVHAHVVCAETELEVLADIKRKQNDANRMRGAMSGAVRDSWREANQGRKLVMDYTAETVKGDGWEMRRGDCCQEVKQIADNSIDFQIFSPPFSNLYIYSDSAFDMGNATGDEEFFTHFKFLIPELLRIAVPGWLCAVHCKDLPLYRNRDDASGLQDFPADISRAFTNAGWVFHSRVTIWKCPVTERERTNSHGLLHRTAMEDCSRVRQGMADYLLVFRKNPADGTKSDKPIVRPHGFTDWPGDPELDPRTNPAHPSKYARKPGKKPRMIPADAYLVTKDNIDASNRLTVDLTPSVNIWQRLADPVWFHIDQREVLNYKAGTAENDEKHICVARDSLVLSEYGYVPIQDVEVGDSVLTHKGRWQKVVAKRCNGVNPVVRVKANGVPNLRVTPTHKVLVRHAGADIYKHREHAKSSTPLWMEAKDTKAHYVNLPTPPIEESPYSADEWWLVGRWLGDGHTDTRGALHISCAHDEVYELVGKLGDHAGYINRHPGTATQIRISDPKGRIRDLLLKFGSGASGKKLPREAMCLNPQKAEALLSGYLSADGHWNSRYDRWMGSSVSRPLLLGMAVIAQRVRGVTTSVYAGRPARKSLIQGREVNCKQDWIFSIPPRNLSGFILEDGAWKKVRQVSNDGEAEVWDLQIEEDESFVVEGCVVHNCPLQLGVVREAVYLWTNPGDLVFSPFAGVGSEGYESLLQGRRFLGIELKKSYLDVACGNLKRAAAKGKQPNLFTGVA